MNITLLVDALGPQLTGIGRYTLELCRRIPGQSGVGRVGFYFNGHFLDEPEQALSDPPRMGRGSRWLRRRLDAARLRRDLVHGPNYFLPRRCERGIITVHDLSVFRYPETHPAERLTAFAKQFERSLEKASHIITDTETVRYELISEFGIAKERVSAIPLGVDERYRPRREQELASVLARYGLAPRSYALCVSTIEPRKKMAELVQAWSLLPTKLRDSMPLILAGGEGWLSDIVRGQIRAGEDAGWLRYIGFVPEADLPILYAGAGLFLYPSIYEGFGLPPLEAMASGVPVLVSNRSCLPEVCENAAAYIDPDDVEGFRDAIASALLDQRWQRAASEAGLQRASSFSWAKCAAETAQIYRKHAH